MDDKMIFLDSVGYAFDKDELMVYPMYDPEVRAWDTEMGFELDGLDMDWFDGLSKQDYEIVKPYL